MKKLLSVLLSLVLVVGLTACGGSKDSTSGDASSDGKQKETTVKIGLTGTIYEDIWNPIKERLKGEGINIELVQFSDFSLPNAALSDGEIDMNAFQHHAYFNNDTETNGYELSAIGDTFVIAMNIYSNKIKDVSELKDGDKVAVPNDASNEGRALKLLDSAGVITLKEDAGANPEVKDIEKYNTKIELVEADASNVFSMLPDVAAAVINGNYALDCGLDPQKDGIFLEKDYADDSYYCLIAVRSEDKDNEVYQRIVKEFQSEQTKEIFKEEFKGFFVPAWELETNNK